MDVNKPKRILIVEDDEFLRDFYNELLITEGYTVDTASDGQMGEDKIRLGSWDLIMLDIMLPKKDGLTILQDLKNEGGIKKFGNVIVLTNLGSDTVINQAFSLGAEGYLIKSSMDPEQVLNEIRSFLNKKVN